MAAAVVTSGLTPRAAVAPYDKTSVPTARELHMLNRMGCGFSRSSYARLRKAGGELAWFEQQLDPASINESAKAESLRDWFPDLRNSPQQIWDDDRTGRKQGWEYARDLSNYSLLRRIYSRRTVLESMVELWSNHLHIDSTAFPGFTHRPAYDAMVRRHALGRFEELLVEASLHPAMRLFLDNWKSVRGAPNENHGRELLELHTLGREGGYTEAMVKDSAKILSGYTVVSAYGGSGPDGPVWSPVYDPTKHTLGPVRVLEFTAANDRADGQQLAIDYLRYLANHPTTAQRIARKLALRFVSDTPSKAVVDEVAQAYLESGTDIKQTLRALVRTEEFWASAGQKVRTPIDDVVATARVLRVSAAQPTGGESFGNALSWTLDSTLVFQWPRPDGAPDRGEVWASPTRMLNSWRMHWSMGGGWWPKQDVTYRAPKAYLPQDRIRFDKFVDHLSRVLLGRVSTSRLLQAACEGTDTGPEEVITVDHAVIRWKFPRLCGVLLDSPAHMTR